MPYKVGKKKIFYVGEDGSEVKLRNSVLPQEFSAIKTECLKLKSNFEDSEFPANVQSIGYIDVVANRNVKIEQVVWKRPPEIASKNEKAVFFIENDARDGGALTRFDINQGTLGDCWFLVAVENITLEPKLLEFIIPADNSSFDEDYCGLFHFRFWHKGVWLDVVIDDRLPCVWNSQEDKWEVIFLRCIDNEFWPALLEKAYAKLMGSYKVIEYGLPNEAMEDFTGGMWEIFYLDKGKVNDCLFQTLLETYERGSFMAAGTGPNRDVINAGLIMSHAYSISCVKRLEYRGRNVDLLRLRNPYGNWMEWRGAWGDGAVEWEEIDKEVKNELALTFRDDGEFWIEYQDLQKHFSFIHACHLSPEALDSEANEPKWEKWNCQGFIGSWPKTKFAPENQHLVTVGHFHDDDHSGAPKGSLIITLMNKNIPLSGKARTPQYGFEVYRVESQTPPFPESFFQSAQMEGSETTNLNMREVALRLHLDPGTYCIIPYCAQKDYEGQYLLRAVAERQYLVDTDRSYKSSWNCNVM